MLQCMKQRTNLKETSGALTQVMRGLSNGAFDANRVIGL